MTRERPVAVILGYPGMGKSTLLAGLAFHMATKHLNRWHDIAERMLVLLRLNNAASILKSSDFIYNLSVFQSLHPLLFPILLNLREYVKFIEDGHMDATITSYLQENWKDHFPILQRYLKDGRCIVLFDGLDEVGREIRIRVQRDINGFIKYYKRGRLAFYNRFLITSRAACFDHNAFPDVECFFYTLALLTRTQIEQLLNDYCREFATNNPGFHLRQNEVLDEAKKRAKTLGDAINSDVHLEYLASNPLLLYLLVVVFFREEKVDFPSQRIELFEVATSLLLEGHSESRALPPIENLGP